MVKIVKDHDFSSIDISGHEISSTSSDLEIMVAILSFRCAIIAAKLLFPLSLSLYSLGSFGKDIEPNPFHPNLILGKPSPCVGIHVLNIGRVS